VKKQEMSAAKKTSFFIYIFIAFISPCKIAYSGSLYTSDSIKTNSVLISKSNNIISPYQIPSDNFFRTDSIFSFRSEKGYVPSLIHNFGKQAIAPIKFNTKEWLITGTAIGITAALINFDSDIDEWAGTLKQKHNWVNKASPLITEFGGNYGVYSVLSIGLISAVFKDQKGVHTSLLATQAMITSGVWAQIIKQITGRERPKASYIYSYVKGGKWYGPFEKYTQPPTDDKSNFAFDAFPSGHTATAFSIATVFASQYSDKKAIPVISYSLATLVGISRMTENEHWSSDVFVGALLGYLCGKQVVSNFNRTHRNLISSQVLKEINKTELTFIQNRDQIGFSLKW
jgi:membrane-associated PAP2 superfamily phosphatase